MIYYKHNWENKHDKAGSVKAPPLFDKFVNTLHINDTDYALLTVLVNNSATIHIKCTVKIYKVWQWCFYTGI